VDFANFDTPKGSAAASGIQLLNVEFAGFCFEICHKVGSSLRIRRLNSRNYQLVLGFVRSRIVGPIAIVMNVVVGALYVGANMSIFHVGNGEFVIDKRHHGDSNLVLHGGLIG